MSQPPLDLPVVLADSQIGNMNAYHEHVTSSFADSRVVTRYMGSGITASGSGSWTRDPGSQVMGSGSANFFYLGGDQGSIAF